MSAPDLYLEHLPRGLTKAEKSAVSRVIAMRESAGDPVAPIEADAVLDYVRTHARMAKLEQTLRRAERAADFCDDGHLKFSEKMSATAALDRAASAVRRLRKDLRLNGKPAR